MLDRQVRVALLLSLDGRTAFALVRRNRDRFRGGCFARLIIDSQTKLRLVQLLTLATAEELLL